MEEEINLYRILVRKCTEKWPFGILQQWDVSMRGT
jgi:hypothetical protein